MSARQWSRVLALVGALCVSGCNGGNCDDAARLRIELVAPSEADPDNPAACRPVRLRPNRTYEGFVLQVKPENGWKSMLGVGHKGKVTVRVEAPADVTVSPSEFTLTLPDDPERAVVVSAGAGLLGSASRRPGGHAVSFSVTVTAENGTTISKLLPVLVDGSPSDDDHRDLHP